MKLHSELFTASREADRAARAAELGIHRKAVAALDAKDMPTDAEVQAARDLRAEAVALLNEMLACMRTSSAAIHARSDPAVPADPPDTRS